MREVAGSIAGYTRIIGAAARCPPVARPTDHEEPRQGILTPEEFAQQKAKILGS